MQSIATCLGNLEENKVGSPVSPSMSALDLRSSRNPDEVREYLDA